MLPMQALSLMTDELRYDPAQDPDRENVDRFQSGVGTDVALARLFDRHGPVTYAFFRRRIGNEETAAELNQELWLAVVKALPEFRRQSSFRTWLFRMAHNSLWHLRRRWRTHLDEIAPDVPVELWQSLESDVESPQRAIEQQQMTESLTRCLATLAEVERAVIVGQYWEGATLANLTARLSLTNASGARATLIAAQRKLKRCLLGEEA